VLNRRLCPRGWFGLDGLLAPGLPLLLQLLQFPHDGLVILERMVQTEVGP
jgi:hypothetical protein